LPEIAPAELATLRTLRDVVRRLDTNASASSNPVETPAERKSGVAGVAEPRGKADRALFLMTPRLVPAASADFDITRRRAGEVIYVTNEAPEIAAELVRILRDRNIAAELVTAVPARGSAVISLAGLGRELGTKSGLPVHLAALSSARAVAHHPQVEERLFVTVQGANGFGLAGDPGEGRWGAGLAGIAKTAGREWPGAGVKAIDVAEGARPEHIAQWIAAELLSGGAEAEVAFAADGSRYAVVCAPDGPAPNIGLPLPDGGVVIVSGGARGVTARAAEALAAEGGLRLALLGRTKMAQAQGELAESSNVIQLTKLLAARAEAQGEVIDLIAVKASACELAASNELRANLARLAERGIQAMYLAVDVRDATAVAAAVDRVRSHWGPISGIVHGAGILGDKRIADLSDTQFADVYETKVKGLQSLLDATRADPIRLVAVFSSIAARTGNAGQAAYAAGNDVLNKIAQHEARARGVGSVVRSYNWGPWDGGMVEPALKSHFQRQGVSLIAQTDGAEFFASDVAHARPVEIVAAASDRLPQRELKFFSRIDTMVFPELLDHQIHGRIVVPIAVVVERMLALALSARQRSDKQVLIRDLRILSGITLGLEEACRLCVRAVPMKGQSETLEITLSDETGRARYCAIAELCDVLPAKLSLPVAVGAAWPITVAEAYKSSLFHGPRLQAIESLERISADGGSARLLTEDRLGHPETERAIDIALIDGGLQLGLLWAKHQKGFVALPQRLGEVRVHRRPPRGEGLLCVFAARPRSASHIDFDFRFQTLAGECLAEIANAEFFAYQP
jgi:NAD(P)-dependent dehydrogenase (short-subunit alcohol dehydrogenase family)